MLQFRQRAGRPDAHDGPAGIEAAIGRFDVGARLRGAERNVNGGKNSASEREQVRGENHAVFRQAGVLENFRRVAMREQVVGLEVFVDFDELEVATGVFAGTAGAGFAIAHDAAVGGNQAGVRERAQRKNHAGGVAAGIGD